MAPRDYALIVNSRSGIHNGLKVVEHVQPFFEAASARCEVFRTESRGHGTEIARTLELERYRGLGVIGGDGTIHEVVNGLMARPQPHAVPLGIIPAGSGNSVALHLGIRDLKTAVESMLRGQVESLDLIRVAAAKRTCYCLNIVGWGMAVDINRTAESLRFLGPIRYTLAAALRIAFPRRRRARVVLDGEVLDDTFCMAIACNTRYTGKGMLLAPKAELFDGKMDVVFVRQATRQQMLQLFQQVYQGGHLDLPFVEYRQVRSFAVESAGEDDLNLDGEIRDTTPFSAEILPRALPVFTPFA